ncbi:DUF5330 domain-containing protein [Pararhizobium mangrovi]|uniref:DUF5330 domain-containing protein n=1 Tax=Pararhizobium mangrovi TaxID=2590452 RepID=A0A506UHD4_9HYPH|nr:DUF5330 domain-containing protein [Pararhizobium mangrovi]TPW32727.1 hypothetical protein FJU11_00425 [Pararhizobium mangrovi]
MRFLIKMAFWFTLVLVLLPLTQPGGTDTDEASAPPLGETLIAATSAVQDVSGICSRRPEVCQTGGEALGALGERAREGAFVAYRFLDRQFGDREPESGRSAETREPAAVAADRPHLAEASTRYASMDVPVPTPAPTRTRAADRGPGVAPAVQTHSARATLPRPYQPPNP